MNSRERHEVFKQGVRESWTWAGRVIELLRSHGLPAREGSDRFVREENPGLEYWKGEAGDILCGRFIIEVKALRFAFTGPTDFPFDAPMVESSNVYDAKVLRGKGPHVYVNVSKATGGMMWMSVKESRESWFARQARDSRLKRLYVPYYCPKKFWYPIGELVDTLKGELGL